jgi:hypothetical protein
VKDLSHSLSLRKSRYNAPQLFGTKHLGGATVNLGAFSMSSAILRLSRVKCSRSASVVIESTRSFSIRRSHCGYCWHHSLIRHRVIHAASSSAGSSVSIQVRIWSVGFSAGRTGGLARHLVFQAHNLMNKPPCVSSRIGVVLLVGTQNVMFGKYFLQSVQKFWLRFCHVDSEDLQDLFVHQNAALKIGIFDGHQISPERVRQRFLAKRIRNKEPRLI